MNKFIYMGVGALVTAVVGVGVYVGLKARKGSNDPVAIKGGDNETLQSSSILSKNEEEASSILEVLYTRLSTFLLFDTTEQEGVTLDHRLDKLMDAKIVRPLVVHGTSIIEDADTLMSIAQLPQQFTKDSAKQTLVYIGSYKPTDSAIIVVQYQDLRYVMYCPSDDRFVINGTPLAGVNTFCYLQILLEHLMDQWNI